MTLRERAVNQDRPSHTTSLANWLGILTSSQLSDSIELLLPYRDEFASADPVPVIRSGIIAALADLAASEAIALHHGHTQGLRSLRIEYLEPVATGQPIRAHASITGHHVAVHILSSTNQKLIAHAWGAYMPIAQLHIQPASSNQAALQPVYPN